MPQFYTLLTDTGQAKLANAVALGGTIEITELAVGDGGGSLPTPDSSATALINEVRRAPINTSIVDPDNPSWIVVEQVLPPDVGGWTIREIGIYDVDGDLIGIGNYPETYKPVLAEGSSRTQTVRFVLEVSDTAAVTLKVDPSVVLATREYVDDQRAAHEASRAHPAATELLQGMIKRASQAKALAGDDNADAMTALRVYQAFSQFGLGAADVPEITDFEVDLEPGFYSAEGDGRGNPTNGAPVGSGGYALIAHVSKYRFYGVCVDVTRHTTNANEARSWRGVRTGSTGPLAWSRLFQSRDVASEAQALGGSDDDVPMTPLKVAQYAAQYGVSEYSKLISGTNLDDLSVNGFFQGEFLENSPSGSNTTWWYIVSQIHNQAGYRAQIAINLSEATGGTINRIYLRRKVGGVWGDWEKHLAESDFSTNDQAADGTLDSVVMTPKSARWAYDNWNSEDAGMVAHFAANTAPPGWLKANGAEVSRTTYGKLFNAIGTIHGAGDGSTTFNLPDLRGNFVRSFDDGRGVDPGRTVGEEQGPYAGKNDYSITTFSAASGTSVITDAVSINGNVIAQSGSESATIDNIAGDTRPRNMALLGCIKY